MNKEVYEDVKCVACGKSPIHFHHIYPEGKLWSISITPKKYLEYELKKCVPLCPSCHRRLHGHNLPGFEHLLQKLTNEQKLISYCGSISSYYSKSKNELLKISSSEKFKIFVKNLK